MGTVKSSIDPNGLTMKICAGVKPVVGRGVFHKSLKILPPFDSRYPFCSTPVLIQHSLLSGIGITSGHLL